MKGKELVKILEKNGWTVRRIVKTDRNRWRHQMTYTYPMIAHCDDDGFWAEFPDLPGCLTEGNTETELLKNAKEALQGFLEVLLSEKDVLPQPTSLFRLTVPKNCASKTYLALFTIAKQHYTNHLLQILHFKNL